MFRGHYDDWNISRMRGIKKYIGSDFFKLKTLLELGCAYAYNGNKFHEWGAIVTSSDAREQHIASVKELYPHLQTVIIDCDNFNHEEKYDIILHWGLLYHLKEIETHLEKISSVCNILLLETEVADSSEDNFFISVDETNYLDQSFHLKGIRPSQSYVEKILEKNGFKYQRIEDSILNTNVHIYDWEIKETKTWQNGKRRFWICWKNIDSPIIYPKDKN